MALPREALLPAVPPSPNSIPLSAPLRSWLERVLQWCRDLVRALEIDIERTHGTVNGLLVVGRTLTTAGATLALEERLCRVEGTDTITTLVAPRGDFSGTATLVTQAGGWALGTGGNVARALGPTVAGQAVIVVWSPQDALWYVT